MRKKKVEAVCYKINLGSTKTIYRNKKRYKNRQPGKINGYQ